MTLADEDTNPILTDNANRTFQGNLASHASHTSYASYASYRIYTEMVTISSGAIWWPNLQLMQVAPIGGQICSSCNWRHLVAKFGTYASGATICWRDNSSLDAIPWIRCASGNVLTLQPI